MPLLAVYTARAAVNAFTESLALELRPLIFASVLILPDAPSNPLRENARRTMGQLRRAMRRRPADPTASGITPA